MSGSIRNGRQMLTTEMVMGALQGFRDSGQRYVTSTDVRRAVELAYPDVVLNKGAVNRRLKRLVAAGKVNDIQDARRGIDPLWELL